MSARAVGSVVGCVALVMALAHDATAEWKTADVTDKPNPAPRAASPRRVDRATPRREVRLPRPPKIVDEEAPPSPPSVASSDEIRRLEEATQRIADATQQTNANVDRLLSALERQAIKNEEAAIGRTGRLLASLGPVAPAAIGVPPFPPPSAAPPTPQPGETPAPRWYDRIAFEGLLDSYFSYKLFGAFRNSVALRAYDTQSGTFQLAYARLSASVQTKPVGLRLDVGFGPVADLSSLEPGPSELWKHIVQGYITFTLPLKKTFTIDVGKFYTYVGTEVIDANQNWNYSRSFLFTYGPFTHTGVRAAFQPTSWLTLQASLTNGWDRVTDGNGMKTVSAGLLAIVADTTLMVNYYVGPEQANNRGWRHLIDLVVGREIGKRFAFNFNAVYGREDDAQWWGASLQARVKVAKAFRLAFRGEYFGDPNGARTAIVLSSTPPTTVLTDLHLGELTVTAAFPILQYGEIRLEGRQDFANKLAFHEGRGRYQTTFTAAALAWF